jgi:hypothetical protein
LLIVIVIVITPPIPIPIRLSLILNLTLTLTLRPIHIRIRTRTIPIPIRRILTRLELVIAAPLRRRLEAIKRLAVDAERPLRVARVGDGRRARAAQRLPEGLQVGQLAQEQRVPRDQADLPVCAYERGLRGGVGEGGEGEEEGEEGGGEGAEHGGWVLLDTRGRGS